jgi:methionyl-tRNA synthetase
MAGGQPFFVTTPIYYVNGSPHFGHAYTSVSTDAMARFMRLDGRRVLFLTGTDEHGQKVEQSARAAGLDPQAFCDRVSAEFREMTRLMNCSNDDFIRTTEPRHVRSCQALWQKIAAAGDIYLGKFAGWYAVRDEAFYDEAELVDGKAPTGAEVEWYEEENYFFRLSAWQERLLDYYERHPDCIAPAARRNEVISFVKGGLKDLSISRSSFSWGVPVPGDPKHVMYVWLDALTNYISAVGYPDTDGELYRTFWPADLHMIGKDIIRFHCVYWPAFLMSAGVAPPKRVFAQGWWTVEGHKMSKSLGNFIPPRQLVDKYGLDAVRYFMLRELPSGSDGDLSHRAIVGRINGDLANGFGNLAQRVLSMVQQYCGGRLPPSGALAPADEDLLAAARAALPALRAAYREQQFHKALDAVWKVVGDANRYVDEQAPWSLRKTDRARMETVLATLVEVLRHLGILMQPVVPAAAAGLLDQLAIPAAARDFAALSGPGMPPGTALPKPGVLFPRYVEGAAP